jgi:hypothetical protein
MEPSAKRAYRLFNQWEDRGENYLKQFGYELASKAQAQVKKRIPRSKEFAEYRKSLTVSSVNGSPDNSVNYVLQSVSKPKALREQDRDVVVLYVKSRRSKGASNRYVDVLEQFGPWTMDTIPRYPSPSEGTLIKRVVSSAEVEAVRRARRRTRSQWTKALRSAQVMQTTGDRAQSELNRLTKGYATTDMTQFALRAEFGVNRRPQPHWRVGISETVRKEVPALLKSPDLVKGFMDPLFLGWASWPTETKKKIAATRLSSFGPFMRRLGLKFR